MGVRPPAKQTHARILDVAERLVQTRGFNGFSYADISAELQIQKASLHHHFSTKEELGKALIARYEERFMGALRAIEAETADAVTRLERYVGLYVGVLKEDRMCLCGMLAADFPTLPKAMREGVHHFFAENEGWLSRVLEAGRNEGVLHFSESAQLVAQYIASSLEGAMLVARTYGRVDRFEALAERLLGELQRPSVAAAG